MIEVWLSAAILLSAAAAFGILGYHKGPFAIWSPVYLVPTAYLLIGVWGFLYYNFSEAFAGGFYDLHVSDALLSRSVSAYFAAIASFIMGALSFFISSRARHDKHDGQVGSESPAFRKFGRFNNGGRSPATIGLVFYMLPLILVVAGNGVEAFLLRDQYLVEQSYIASVLGTALALPTMFALGRMCALSRRFLVRLYAIALLSIYTLTFLTLSSRVFVILLLFFISGLALGRARYRTIIIISALWMALLPLMLQVPLHLRAMPHQGLLPLVDNLSQLTEHPGIKKLYYDGASVAQSNLTFGVPLAGYVSKQESIGASALFVSLSPLPSAISIPGYPDWSSIRHSLRVSPYIPYNAIGELLNHGWVWLVVYYYFVGFIAGWLDNRTRSCVSSRSRLGYMLGCGFLLLFSVLSTQYNLRSSTRLIWYAIFIAGSWKYLSAMRLHRYERGVHYASGLMSSNRSA